MDESYNSGSYNSGNRNSGSYNSGSYNSGLFNTNEPSVRIFNIDTNLKRSQIDIPYVNLKINEWIPESRMTEQQKIDDENFHVKKGTLIKRTYKEAWSLYWGEASEEDKNTFKNLPNFDPEIFEEITGINVSSDNKVKVIANGKEVWISKESARGLGL